MEIANLPDQKKRGRKPKNAVVENLETETVETIMIIDDNKKVQTNNIVEDVTPKKRGRKPKIQNLETPVKTSTPIAKKINQPIWTILLL